MRQRPDTGEYAAYFMPYINLVPEGDLLQILKRQSEELSELLQGVSEEQAGYRYAPGKWSLKEVLGHIADTERVMSYRLLRVARGDATPLPGFDENLFVSGAAFDRIPLQALLEDFKRVREATLSLLSTLPEEAWTRRGVINNTETTARALAYILAGHELHHRKVIEERYLASK